MGPSRKDSVMSKKVTVSFVVPEINLPSKEEMKEGSKKAWEGTKKGSIVAWNGTVKGSKALWAGLKAGAAAMKDSIKVEDK